MAIQLPNKFIGNYLYITILLLTTSCSVASAYIQADSCQHPAPPVITGSAKAVCRGESVILTATGCTGTVIWSNGEAGFSMEVKPQQTTKYTAICRTQPGCISCFAEVWKITVNTPDAPILTSSAKIICPTGAVTLTATNCSGTVRWPDQSTGATWTGKLQQTTTFQTTCEQNNCFSNPSARVTVPVTVPATPIITASQTEICAGQPAQLTASGCLGTIHWADGSQGLSRTILPDKTTTYRAICQLGTCRSDSSEAVFITVRTAEQKPALVTTLRNGCPFQTADLSQTITAKNPSLSNSYQFRMGPSLTSTPVQSPGAVLAGTYYVFGRNSAGCYTDPVAVSVTITPCEQAVPPCLSDPATVAIQLDSLDWARGIVHLTAQLGGSASGPAWQSDGGGLFTTTGSTTRYLLSELDRQRGRMLFTVSTPDSDGSGPCSGASVQQTIAAPSREMVGLSKKVSEPIWLMEGTTNLVELTYQLTVSNPGTNPLTKLQIADDLEAAFSASGALIQSLTVRADSGLAVNPNYSGRGADTTLLSDGKLTSGKQSRVWLTVRLDVSQANTLTFTNKATAMGVDVNGAICRDRSTNGVEADPDQNGDPSDNDEPTLVTLHARRPEESETVFIPEGFSPNGDGINDKFVIQRLPVDLTVQLEVYNKWGNLVYRSANYRNDWDGTTNQGINLSAAKGQLPDGTYYYQIRLSDGRAYVRFMTMAR